jgi:Tol biopolymer transport system component
MKIKCIVVLGLTTFGLMALAGCGGDDSAPSPQPSSTFERPFGKVGGWIAYSSGDGIWAVDPAHPERRIRLSRAGDPIGWSSDGTKLLIQRKSQNQVPGGARETDLVVLDADGTETRLTNAQAFDTGGSFSRDGSEVVYATSYSAPKGSAIYAVSSDGGAPRLILRPTRRVSIEGRSFLTDVYQPALSPDGTQIGYFDGMRDHHHNLCVMNADGTERRLLLDDEELAGRGNHMNALTWSPDGEWLAFHTDARIYLVRPDGTALRPVVEKKRDFISAPAVQWSPDGSRIAYFREGALSILNVDGGNERIVEAIRATSIAWNPAA